MKLQGLILCSLLLIASAMAAGTVVRPADSSGVTWYPLDLGTDSATLAFKAYTLSGQELVKSATAPYPPYPQGCFMTCVTTRDCLSWTYQKSTKKCSLFKNAAYTASYQKVPCVKWEKASSDFVSGWIYFGEDGPEGYSVCKK